MFTPSFHKSKSPKFRKRYFVHDSNRCSKSNRAKRDLKSLTLEDFKPPIALKVEFPKIRKIKHVSVGNAKKHTEILNNLYVTGKYACILNKYSPVVQKNIGLDTTDMFQIREHMSFYD